MRLTRSSITYTIMLLLITLLAMTGVARGAAPYFVKEVIDGDTVRIQVNGLPKELGDTLLLRIIGVDTPEKGFRANCQKEADLAIAAQAFTTTVVALAQHVNVRLDKWDKFGGRVLGDLRLDGEWLSARLIAGGYAKPYAGKGPKHDWCEG
jgi:micrococcal nuclease